LIAQPDDSNERGKQRLSYIARKLIEITVQEPQIYTLLQHHVWMAIAKEDALLEPFLDELVKAALRFGFGDERTESICSIAATFETVMIRAKIIARLRKALSRSS